MSLLGLLVRQDVSILARSMVFKVDTVRCVYQGRAFYSSDSEEAVKKKIRERLEKRSNDEKQFKQNSKAGDEPISRFNKPIISELPDSKRIRANIELSRKLGITSSGPKAQLLDNFNKAKNKPKSKYLIIELLKRIRNKFLMFITFELGGREEDEFYFKNDKMDSKSTILVYVDEEAKSVKMLGWATIVMWPILSIFLVRKYFNEQHKEDKFEEFDEEFLQYDEFRLHHLLLMLFVYTAFVSFIYMFMNRSVVRIYYNPSNKIFIFLMNKFPLFKNHPRCIVPLGQANDVTDPSKIDKLIGLNVKLSDNTKFRIHNDKFIAPLYGNLLYGYSKGNRLNPTIEN